MLSFSIELESLHFCDETSKSDDNAFRLNVVSITFKHSVSMNFKTNLNSNIYE